MLTIHSVLYMLLGWEATQTEYRSPTSKPFNCSYHFEAFCNLIMKLFYFVIN